MDYLDSYRSPMDREYSEPLSDAERAPLIPMGAIGISAAPMRDQLQELKTRIFQGASKVELGFMGQGKGSMQGGNTTPEMYGVDQKRAIRELAELNKIELTTHATPNHGSLAGATQEGFSDEARRRSLSEIQRTIDFAAEVARGGPVVIHTGEWARPISELSRNLKDERFEEYNFNDFGGKKGSESGPIYFADEESGKITALRRDIELHLPNIDEEATKKHGFEVYKRKETGEIDVVKKKYDDIVNDMKRKYRYDEKKGIFYDKDKDGNEVLKTPEQMVLKDFYLSEYNKAHAESLYHLDELEKDLKIIDRLKEQLKHQKEIDATIPKENLEDYKEAVTDRYGRSTGEKLLPHEKLEREIKDRERTIQFVQERSSAHTQQAENIRENMDKFKPIEDVGLKKTAQTVAMAAMHALDKEKEMKLPRPLYVAPENVFPEQYGAHPQELKKIIQESRKAMEGYLISHRKMGKEDAIKTAESHIKATFDIGHANTWKKYFKGSEKEFKDWLLGEVDDLMKNKIIGHVHISDNFGYEDEHVTPGQGNVPLQEFIKRIKNDKSISVNVESAHQDFESMMGAWRVFGNPISGAAGGRGDRWLNIENSYFGSTRTPKFIYGEYAPSEDFRGSPFWSGLPLE